MSATALYDSIARIARHEAGARASASVGTVVDLFTAEAAPFDHAVTIELRDSGLILPRVPIAVGALGFAAIPAPGDLVLVVFLDGDLNAPVVVGRLYHPELEPPKHARDQWVIDLPAGSDSPTFQLMLDTAAPKLTINLPSDVAVELEDGVVRCAVGSLEITLESAGGGRATLAAGGSTITLKQDGDVTIKSAAKLKLEANEIELAGAAKVTVNGAQVEIN